MAITVNGVKCKVVESLGYNHDMGGYVKRVVYDGKEQMAVGGPGRWRLWTPTDRTQPLREAMARGWPGKQV